MVDSVYYEHVIDLQALDDLVKEGRPVMGEDMDVAELVGSVEHAVDSPVSAEESGTLHTVQDSVRTTVDLKTEVQQHVEVLHTRCVVLESSISMDEEVDEKVGFEDVKEHIQSVKIRFDNSSTQLKQLRELILDMSRSSTRKSTLPTIVVTASVGSEEHFEPGPLGLLQRAAHVTIQVLDTVRRRMRSVPYLRSLAQPTSSAS